MSSKKRLKSERARIERCIAAGAVFRVAAYVVLPPLLIFLWSMVVHNTGTPCDEPLNAMLAGWATIFSMLLLTLVLSHVVGDEEFRRYGKYIYVFLTVCVMAWIIYSNTWVFMAFTCRPSSSRYKLWVFGLYDTAFRLAVAMDVVLVVVLVLIVVYRREVRACIFGIPEKGRPNSHDYSNL